MIVVAVLLAAGLSTRFGSTDKISAPLNGQPLGLHAAHTLAELPLAHRFVVSRPGNLDWQPFDLIPNLAPKKGLSHSIALGVSAARQVGADAILLALADMPFVPAAHFKDVIDRYSGHASLIASINGDQRMPPALFGADWFSQLEALTGDRGARHLLDRAEIVHGLPGDLLDIDHQDQLVAATPKLKPRLAKW